MDAEFEHYDRLPKGAVAFGRYVIMGFLGTGASSVVYLCRDLHERGRKIALKVLRKESSFDPHMVRRFRNEINASYRVSHPNVVRALQLYTNSKCEAYAMEYVDGQSLGQYIESSPVILIKETCALLEQICSGAQAIHGAGLVHRDLKPDNILVSSAASLKICDFNTALTASRNQEAHEIGEIGTLEFMSPEVITTGRADARSDIYAIGVMGYLMLTGKVAHYAATEAEHIKLKIKGKLKSPTLLRKDCPRDLSHLILRACSSDPEKRFSSAREMQIAINNLDLSQRPSFLERLADKAASLR
jgi:serine/threonine-protein kinase